MADELEAVNDVLGPLGSGDVMSLDEGDEDVIKAQSYLRKAKKSILKRGWFFNCKSNFVLAHSPDGTVTVPNDALKVDAANSTYVAVGKQMYDGSNNTFNIGEPLTVELCLDVDWELMPYVAFECITALAAYRLFRDLDGDKNQTKELKDEYALAIQALRDAQLIVEDHNVFNNPKVSAALQRLKPGSSFHS